MYFGRTETSTATPIDDAQADSNTRTAPRTIALFGLFGCENYGNDGSLEAMISFVRRKAPNSKILCICPRPDVIALRHEVQARPIRCSGYLTGLSKFFSRLMLKIPGHVFDLATTVVVALSVDIMIIPGTGILEDFGDRPFGMPFELFKWCLAARLSRTRLAFVSVGAGPMRRGANRWLLTAAARLAHFRSYRDRLSKDFMENTGLDAREDTVQPDLAFRLPEPVSSDRVPGRLRLGVGVMTYRGWSDNDPDGEQILTGYVEKLAQFVMHVLDRGHDIVFLIGDAKDRIALNKLQSRVRKARPDVAPSQMIVEQTDSLHDQMKQISETDIIVGTRYHTIICAVKMGKPTISIGYARKNDVLLSAAGLGDYCQEIEHLDAQRLIDQFTELVVRRDEHEQRLREWLDENNRNLGRQEAYLLATVLK